MPDQGMLAFTLAVISSLGMLIALVVGVYVGRLIEREFGRPPALPPPPAEPVWSDPGLAYSDSPEDDILPCSRCGEQVPRWFTEAFPTGEIICHHDTDFWRYPKPGETSDEYVSGRRECTDPACGHPPMEKRA